MTKLERFRARRLSNASARIMAAVLREAGIPPGPVLAEAGLRADDVERPDATITGEQELRLEAAFAERTRGRPGLWLDLGSRYRLLAYGPFGLAVLSARSVERAVEFAAGFHELAFTLVDYTLLRDPGGRVLGMDASLAAAPPGLEAFLVERDVAAVRRLLDDMVGGRFPLREIRASIAEPADADAWPRALGTPVRFGCERTQILFAPAWREVPMPYGNPLLEEAHERQCRELLGALETRSSELERVVDLLVRCKGRWPTVDEAGERIGVSARTLRRRLEAQGTTYSALVDRVRRKQAEELVVRTGLTVEHVAEALGYAETASFTHAFKRWTGRSPRDYRRERLDPAAAARYDGSTPPAGGAEPPR